MRAFLATKQRFAMHLRPEDVREALPADERPAELEIVVEALDSLVERGNLRADPDTARVTAVEDFYRKRFVYRLTRAWGGRGGGAATHDEALGRRGARQAVALHDIVTQLECLARLGNRERARPGQDVPRTRDAGQPVRGPRRERVPSPPAWHDRCLPPHRGSSPTRPPAYPPAVTSNRQLRTASLLADLA
ncbi:DUF2397 family protein [Streptomyces sp. URMC 124]|uniref:DUF2397 family protein n=1 Tax=Streptomyces sp. URMC 124 TaxID=3423405 RepID=UPI003F19A560